MNLTWYGSESKSKDSKLWKSGVRKSALQAPFSAMIFFDAGSMIQAEHEESSLKCAQGFTMEINTGKVEYPKSIAWRIRRKKPAISVAETEIVQASIAKWSVRGTVVAVERRTWWIARRKGMCSLPANHLYIRTCESNSKTRNSFVNGGFLFVSFELYLGSSTRRR